jgi:tetratricopeptide (TPR) repeat protein
MVETGKGLLELSFLVKWVRSDTAQPPFVRSQELAMQALDLFREAGNDEGKVRALVTASAMVDPSTKANMLSEAESLAESLGEENLVAMVLAARARGIAMSDRARAAELHRQALDIYRTTGNKRGQAQCLFSLALVDGDSAEKRDCAIEAARMYRAMGDRGEASRCVSIALMNAEEIQPITDLEGLVREGLEDSLTAANRRQEGHFYSKLGLIALAKGNVEEADKYQRWSKDLEAADGLTPHERWENDVEMTKTMISIAKTQGNQDAAKMFQDELKRLKASKPIA